MAEETMEHGGINQKQLVASVCPYCGCGCGLYVEVENERATGIEYMEGHPASEGALCPKGNAALEVVYHGDRLRHPLRRTDDGWKRISWEEAISTVASRLRAIADTAGPDALGFLASAKCTNEENYLFQKLGRMLGSPNIDHCARLCHAPTVSGLVATLGSGAMTNPIADVANSDCLLIVGSNFSEAHPIITRWVADAKDRGATIITVDPRRTPTVWLSDLFLQLRPGTDIALVNGMMKVILTEGLHNQEFIAARTTGFDAVRQVIENYDLDGVAATTGVPVERIQKAARAYARAKNGAIIYCMGITQHSCGHANVVSLANLALLCGHIGRPGAGVLPLRGQNNVQGACDMGALATYLPGYIPAGDAARVGGMATAWGSECVPARSGLTVVEMMHAAAEGKLKGMYIMGENPMVSDPNTNHVEEALRRLDFLVVQDIFLSETAQLADIVLPATAWAESEGSVTSTERRVQWMSPAVTPLGEARPDWEIISLVAKELGFDFNYSGPADVLREVNAVVPQYAGITPERLTGPGYGLVWPCPSVDHAGTPILHAQRFATPDGLARFIPVDHQEPVELPDADYPFILTTGRVVMHYNSGSMTRRSGPLLTRTPELFVELNPRDAAVLGVADGNIVVVATRRGEAAARAVLTDRVGAGVTFMPFHFPGTNALTIDALDERSKIPEFKVAACKVTKRVSA